MITPSPILERRSRADGVPSRGKLPPHCAVHFGFPLPCVSCKGIDAPLAESVKNTRARTSAQDRAARDVHTAAAKASASRYATPPPAPRAAKPAKPSPPKLGQPIRAPKPPPKPKREKRAPGTPPRMPAHQRLITFRGVVRNISAWERATGVSSDTVRMRVRRGIPLDAPSDQVASRRLAGTWSYELDCAVELPPPVERRASRRKHGPHRLPKRVNERPVTFRGETRSMSQWMHVTGFSTRTIRERYEKGIPLDAPVRPGGSEYRGTWDYANDRPAAIEQTARAS